MNWETCQENCYLFPFSLLLGKVPQTTSIRFSFDRPSSLKNKRKKGGIKDFRPGTLLVSGSRWPGLKNFSPHRGESPKGKENRCTKKAKTKENQMGV